MLSVIYSRVHYAECCKLVYYAECHYAECHYAECRYAECCGATSLSFWDKTWPEFQLYMWTCVCTQSNTLIKANKSFQLYMCMCTLCNILLTTKKPSLEFIIRPKLLLLAFVLAVAKGPTI